MEGIKEVIAVVLKDLTKQKKTLVLDAVKEAWGSAVGPAAARHTRIVNLTKDKIQVNVDSSSWLYQLNLKKHDIERRLSRRLKGRQLVLRLGGVGEDNAGR